MPICPECQSSKVWKSGYQYVQGESIQRFLCRDCGYRFSEKGPSLGNRSKPSWIGDAHNTPKSVENLAKLEPLKNGLAGATGLIIDYAWKEKKRGLAESTIKQRIYRLKSLVRKGADLQEE